MHRRGYRESSSDDSDDDDRDMTRNDSVASTLGNIPMSVLSYVAAGAAESQLDDVDIATFKEDCWRMISTAHMGGGLSELSGDLQDGEDDSNRIIVGVRTRPINERERRLGTRGCIEHLSDRRNLIVRKYNWKDEPYDMTFAFDHAFGEESTQDEVGTRYFQAPIRCA
jgi:hypothetical protein